MRKISLAALLVGSLIPPLIAYLARILVDHGSRVFAGTEIGECLGISLLFGIVCSFGFFVICRWVT
jgi:hypothetical protein